MSYGSSDNSRYHVLPYIGFFLMFGGILPPTRRELSDEVDAMDQETLWRQYTALPVDAQRQVADFIIFLATRYRAAPPTKSPQASNLSDEPIVGMWADRDDLRDSTAWVRTMREREWDRRRG
jgi:hypothetical protein